MKALLPILAVLLFPLTSRPALPPPDEKVGFLAHPSSLVNAAISSCIRVSLPSRRRPPSRLPAASIA